MDVVVGRCSYLYQNQRIATAAGSGQLRRHHCRNLTQPQQQLLSHRLCHRPSADVGMPAFLLDGYDLTIDYSLTVGTFDKSVML